MVRYPLWYIKSSGFDDIESRLPKRSLETSSRVKFSNS